MIDRIMMTILREVLQIKFESLLALRQKSKMQKEVLETIRITGLLCNQKTKTSLINSIKQELPRFFGFQEVGLLFRDVKTNLLFTMNEISDDYAKQMLRKTEMEALGNKTKLTKEEEEDILILLDQYKEKKLINFPNNIGITGQVF